MQMHVRNNCGYAPQDPGTQPFGKYVKVVICTMPDGGSSHCAQQHRVTPEAVPTQQGHQESRDAETQM